MTSPGSSRLVGLFNSTSADFDAISPQVWGPAGVGLVEALDLSAGERVIDVCAGTGASALPAAAAVGPTGRVSAIDFAEDLLAIAQQKAVAAGLDNLDTVVADVTALRVGEPPCEQPVDAVACSYGIFFLPDMPGATRGLMDLIRPGGKIGVTVWRAGALQDFSRAYFDAVAEVASETNHQGPRSSANPAISTVDSEEKLAAFFTELGAASVVTSTLRNRVDTTPEFAWAMVLGSGMRGALTELNDAQRQQIRAGLIARLDNAGLTEIDCNTVVGVATV